MAEFLSLAEMLTQKSAVPQIEPAPIESAPRPIEAELPPALEPQPAPEPQPEPPTPVQRVPPGQLIDALRRFAGEFIQLRARAAERFENEAERLLSDLANDVLVRELQLAPADVRALVTRAKQTYEAPEAMHLRLAPEDAELFSDSANVKADDSLERGDLVIELADGTLDLRMGTRLWGSLMSHRVTAS